MWEDIKEILTFKAGIFLSTMMWILFIAFGFCIWLLIMLPFSLAEDKKLMAEQHCVRTDETRTRIIHGTMLVGKITVPTQQILNEYKYDCDDGMRWR